MITLDADDEVPIFTAGAWMAGSSPAMTAKIDGAAAKRLFNTQRYKSPIVVGAPTVNLAKTRRRLALTESVPRALDPAVLSRPELPP
jgi:hypothetical protein